MQKLLLFLSLQLFIVLSLVYANRKYFNRKLTSNHIALISAFLFYLSIIITALATNYILKNELNSFDLNGDGFFTNEEITSDQQIAMRRVISDTGRNLAPIIGIVYSLIYYVVLFFFFWITKTIFQKLNDKILNK